MRIFFLPDVIAVRTARLERGCQPTEGAPGMSPIIESGETTTRGATELAPLTPAASEEGKYALASAIGAVYVRAIPAINAAVVATLKPGEQISVIETRGQWNYKSRANWQNPNRGGSIICI